MTSSFITAVARTPWALRNGSLADIPPEHLLATALSAVVMRRGIDHSRIDRLLVACDTSVGAQDLNLARRVALNLGWDGTIALTVDGQGIGDLALVALSASLPGRTIVAALDSTTTVPPGAGLVRDYGRPDRGVPDLEALESVATLRDLTRSRLDDVAKAMRAPTGRPSDAVAPIRTKAGEIDCDPTDAREFEVLQPLVEGGIQTAWHVAEHADGAAAAMIESDGSQGRPILSAGARAHSPDLLFDEFEKIVRTAENPVIVAEATALVMAAVGVDRPHPSVSSPLSIGSTPSADGLRCLVDACATIDSEFTVVGRGRLGQLGLVDIGSKL